MDINQLEPPFRVGQAIIGRRGTNLNRSGVVVEARQLNDGGRSGRIKYEFKIAWEGTKDRPAETGIVNSVDSIWPNKKIDENEESEVDSCCEVEGEQMTEDENDSIDLAKINAGEVNLDAFDFNENEPLPVDEIVPQETCKVEISNVLRRSEQRRRKLLKKCYRHTVRFGRNLSQRTPLRLI